MPAPTKEATPAVWEPPSDEGEKAEPVPERPEDVLAPPPRPVPFGLRLVVMFGGVLSLLGWCFLGLGMVFVWLVAPRQAPLWAVALGRPLGSAPGVVVESRPTNVRVNDAPVYWHTYTFTGPDGREYHGVSYRTGGALPSGAAVQVEYVSGRPELSQIRGMSRNMVPEWVFPIVGFFPLVGLAFMVSSLRQGLKANRLLAHGQLAWGVLRGKQPTGAKINGREVYKLSFEFVTPDGRKCTASAKTHEPERLEDQRQERLLYDALHPDYAVMLDSLPGSPEVSPAGHLEPPPMGRVIGATLVPTIAVVGHGSYLLTRFVLH